MTMKTIITPIAFLCCLSAFSQNIALDPYFGNDGISFVDNTSEINKIVINSNGDILSAGYTLTGGPGFHISLTKHHADGTLDVNFGTGGITHTIIAQSESVLDIRLQADGKILVAGFANLPPVNGVYNFNSFIARYHPNGIIDSSFATNGIFQQNATESQFNSILVQSDQSLLLIGNTESFSCLTKLTSAGVPDNTFGTNGVRIISDMSNYFFMNWGGIRLSDGSILCYGFDATDFPTSKVTCAKIDSLGNYINSFGVGGKASFDLNATPNTMEILARAQELPDGKIILAGTVSQSGITTEQLILKLKSDGTIDSTFATDGVVHHTLPFKDMLVQSDGKILIGGSKLISANNYGLSISRFNSDGTIDPGFNGTGTFEADLSERSDHLQCMVLVDSDHLLVGGSAKIFDLNSIFILARIDVGQTLSLQENQSNEISLYPNPFSSELNISIANESITAIQLTDATGRLIETFPASTTTTLSLEHLASGMYQVVFINDRQENISRKIIKQ